VGSYEWLPLIQKRIKDSHSLTYVYTQYYNKGFIAILVSYFNLIEILVPPISKTTVLVPLFYIFLIFLIPFKLTSILVVCHSH